MKVQEHPSFIRKVALAPILALSMASVCVLAQQNTTTVETPAVTTTTAQPAGATTQYKFRARDLLGLNIKNANAETIGEINDLIIDGAHNTLTAVLSVGGFLGIGDHLVAVPFDALKIDRANHTVTAQYEASKEQLKAMPAYKAATDASADLDTLHARKLIGAKVTNSSNDKVGEIHDLIITEWNAVPLAILSVGGFLGIGDHLVAAPFDQLQVSMADGKPMVKYETTKEALKQSPEFKYREGDITTVAASATAAATKAADTVAAKSAELWDKTKVNWEEAKTSIKKRWDKLTDEDLAAIDGKREELIAKIQERYGEAKDQASQQVDEWKTALDNSTLWGKVKGNWNQLKGNAKQQWGKLTDDDLMVVDGKRDELIGKLQERYNMTKDEASRQVEDWVKLHQ